MVRREREAQKIRQQLKAPIQLMGGGVQPIPRAEKLQAKMNKIDKVFHREIENRRLQSTAIQDFRRMFGLAGGKINGEKEM